MLFVTVSLPQEYAKFILINNRIEHNVALSETNTVN